MRPARPMWDVLAIAATDDAKAIRRAYAARLREIDPDRDRAAFARLRAAFEWALERASRAARLPPRGEAPEEVPPEPHDDPPPEDVETVYLDWTSQSGTPWLLAQYEPPVDPRPSDQPPEPAGTVNLHGTPQPPVSARGTTSERARERALLIALEAELQRGDARSASQLYFRAAATGAVALGDTERMLVRLFTVALEDESFDGAAFRGLAAALGWDQPRLESAASDVRQRALSRLAAEDWYDDLVATARRRNRRPRFEARVARLILRRRGGAALFRINRPMLRVYLDRLKPHQGWLRDRIPGEWVAVLENRLRRRGLIGHALAGLFIGALLVDALVVGGDSLLSDGLTPALLAFSLPVALLGWLFKVIVVNFMEAWRGRGGD